VEDDIAQIATGKLTGKIRDKREPNDNYLTKFKIVTLACQKCR